MILVHVADIFTPTSIFSLLLSPLFKPIKLNPFNLPKLSMKLSSSQISSKPSQASQTDWPDCWQLYFEHEAPLHSERRISVQKNGQRLRRLMGRPKKDIAKIERSEQVYSLA
jgi:hypothetical protein